jgi:carotenoid 1,2-hydratase
VGDDGRSALSLIAMVGSVFSPFYFASRREGGGVADPLAFPAMNVALYTPGGARWVLTERGRRALSRSADELAVGPSSVRWEGSALVVEFDELTAPIPRRLAGTIRLYPEAVGGSTVTLDTNGRHRWRPIAPRARAEVEIRHPTPLRFSGAAYLDHNAGDEPLEDGFKGWTWSRFAAGDHAAITYDVERRDGSRLLVTRAFEPGGRISDGFPVRTTACTPTMWLMRREVHGDHDTRPEVVRTLEDTPFYSRSLVRTRFFGRDAEGTHEALDCNRFRSRVVQFMLPYRMRKENG